MAKRPSTSTTRTPSIFARHCFRGVRRARKMDCWRCCFGYGGVVEYLSVRIDEAITICHNDHGDRGYKKNRTIDRFMQANTAMSKSQASPIPVNSSLCNNFFVRNDFSPFHLSTVSTTPPPPSRSSSIKTQTSPPQAPHSTSKASPRWPDLFKRHTIPQNQPRFVIKLQDPG